KIEEVNDIKEKIKKYNVILIADIQGFPADKLHEIRKRLRGIAELKVAKNSLFEIALRESGINVEQFKKYLTGTNLYIFTNINPFTLSLILSRFNLKRYAIPGDKADEEVVIPAGDTGLPAGPILSVFGKLKVQTRVQDGKVYVVKDTVIAKPGEVIPVDAIGILQKLGIMPVYVRLKIKVAYDKGLLIEGENLKLNIEEYKNQISSAAILALNTAAEIGYLTPETVPLVFSRAIMRARSLAVEIGYLTPETVPLILQKALSKAYALAYSISSKVDLGISTPIVPQQQAQPTQEAKKEEKKEEEEKKPSEEEIASGLSSLFG
ncbi:MAG: 50S ribosomal protein L10, partial [Sulfolobaceae archaeon]